MPHQWSFEKPGQSVFFNGFLLNHTYAVSCTFLRLSKYVVALPNGFAKQSENYTLRCPKFLDGFTSKSVHDHNWIFSIAAGRDGRPLINWIDQLPSISTGAAEFFVIGIWFAGQRFNGSLQYTTFSRSCWIQVSTFALFTCAFARKLVVVTGLNNTMFFSFDCNGSRPLMHCLPGLLIK